MPHFIKILFYTYFFSHLIPLYFGKYTWRQHSFGTNEFKTVTRLYVVVVFNPTFVAIYCFKLFPRCLIFIYTYPCVFQHIYIVLDELSCTHGGGSRSETSFSSCTGKLLVLMLYPACSFPLARFSFSLHLWFRFLFCFVLSDIWKTGEESRVIVIGCLLMECHSLCAIQ